MIHVSSKAVIQTNKQTKSHLVLQIYTHLHWNSQNKSLLCTCFCFLVSSNLFTKKCWGDPRKWVPDLHCMTDLCRVGVKSRASSKLGKHPRDGVISLVPVIAWRPKTKDWALIYNNSLVPLRNCHFCLVFLNAHLLSKSHVLRNDCIFFLFCICKDKAGSQLDFLAGEK